MDGLESIALAVAHLEDVSRGNQPRPTLSHLSVPNIPNEHPILPLQSGFATSPRFVSFENPVYLNNSTQMHFQQFHAALPEPFAPAHEHQETSSPSPPLTTADTSLSSLESILGLDTDVTEEHVIPGVDEVITRVQKYDVLCGRGGETNHHSGNMQYRHFVKSCQPAYISAKRRDKPKIAERIVEAVRRLGGRFLKRDAATNTWRDVGNTKAREKTSQALREGAPELRTGTTSSSSGSNNNNNNMIINNTSGSAASPLKQDKMMMMFAEDGNNMYMTARNLMPHLVEPLSQEFVSSDTASSSKKMRRTSLDDLATAVLTNNPARHVDVSHHHHQQQQEEHAQGLSPVSSSTIAGDDDSHNSSQSKSLRGPRIKLLKRRLECDEV